jgi:hypothetical protein
MIVAGSQMINYGDEDISTDAGANMPPESSVSFI